MQIANSLELQPDSRGAVITGCSNQDRAPRRCVGADGEQCTAPVPAACGTGVIKNNTGSFMLKRFVLALFLLRASAARRTASRLHRSRREARRGGGEHQHDADEPQRRWRGRGACPNIPEDDPFYEFFRRFMPQSRAGPAAPREFQSQSLGSGFIISADGFMLTNAHVVEAADEITVKLTDKRELKAKVIGADRRTDIALLKIEASGLPFVRFGDPNRLRVGEWVVAIGSPFGFENTVTAGIVSAKGRSLPQENFVPFIQTDVAVNPGNSGGPLFNLRGEVVGINSAIYSRTGGFMGLSFAIPIDVANDIAEQLQDDGPGDPRPHRRRHPADHEGARRQLRPAEAAGRARELGREGRSGREGRRRAGRRHPALRRQAGGVLGRPAAHRRRHQAGQPGRRMQVWRNKADARPAGRRRRAAGRSRAAAAEARGAKPPAATPGVFGMSLTELTDAQTKELKVEGGVLVDDAQGAAARAGIRRGDVITRGQQPGREIGRAVPRADGAGRKRPHRRAARAPRRQLALHPVPGRWKLSRDAAASSRSTAAPTAISATT